MESGSAAKLLLVGFAASVMLILLGSQVKNKLMTNKTIQIGLWLCGFFSLGLLWYVVFWFLTLSTERTLAPWNQWGNLAPPADTWQRQLNDFFKQAPGQYVPAATAMALSGIFFLRGALRPSNQAMRLGLPWIFACLNGAFLIISFLLILPLQRLPDLWLPQPLPAVDAGYHRTWPDFLATSLLLALLLWSQAWITTPKLGEYLERRKRDGHDQRMTS